MVVPMVAISYSIGAYIRRVLHCSKERGPWYDLSVPHVLDGQQNTASP
jgi:hypothetical protein